MQSHLRVFSCSVVSNSLRPHRLYPNRLLCPWDFTGKNTGVGCLFLLQGILPAQGLIPRLFHLLHWQADRWILYHYRHLGSFGSTYEKLKNIQN